MTTQLSPPSPHYPAFHLSSIFSSFSPYWPSPSISCLAELLSHQQPFLVWCPSLLFSSSNKKLDLNSFQLPPLTKRGCCSDTGGRGGRQLFIWDEQELYGTEVAAADRYEQLWWHYCRRLEHHHKRGDTFQSDRGSDSSRFVSQVWTTLALWLLISTPTRARIQSPTLISLYWLVICNQWLHRKNSEVS